MNDYGGRPAADPPADDDNAGEEAEPGPADTDEAVKRAEALFRDNLPTIERAIGFVCSRHALPKDVAEEFASHVRLKLMEDGYAVLRKYRREAELATFLAATISFRCLDYLNAIWGRWRNSAEARRLGGHAPLIEQLMARDGHSAEEAFEILRTNHRATISRQEFESLVARLPNRVRRQHETDEPLDNLPASESADQGVIAEEERVARQRLLGALQEELAALPEADRLLLKLSDEDGLTMREIAGIMGGETPALFRRRDRIRAIIRKRLEERGFAAGEGLA